MRLKHPLLALSLTACASGVSSTATPSNALPPIRPLGEAEATVLLGMNSTPSVRVLSTGRVLATDIMSRRLVITDADLKSIDTVFDATSAPPLTYPSYSPLLRGLADTTLFYDGPARGYRVIDPTGRVVRRLPIADQSLIRGLQVPYPLGGLDPRGRLVFSTQRSYFEKPVPGVQPQAESLMVARVTFDRTGWDSLTSVMGSGQRTVTDTSANPPRLAVRMPVVDRGDAWALLADGTIVVIRSSDFHADWIGLDGSRRSTPPVRWAWAKYTKAERDALRSSRVGQLGTAATRTVSGSGTVVMNPPTQMIDTVPERVPAFAPSSARPDLDGRVWLELGPRVVIGAPTGNPVVVAVIDTTGQIIERLELPPRRTIVGFDRAGNVYAVTALGREGFAVERYRYRRP